MSRITGDPSAVQKVGLFTGAGRVKTESSGQTRSQGTETPVRFARVEGKGREAKGRAEQISEDAKLK